MKQINKTEQQVADSHLTIEEAQTSLSKLSKADMIRLRKIDAVFARGNPTNTLLADALTKTWDGTRSWKRGMGACEHLYGVMRSLANNEHKKQTVSKNSESLVDEAGNEKSAISVCISSPSPEALLLERESNAEREQADKSLVKEVFELFADDEDAAWVLMGCMDGQSAEKIRELTGMDKKRYDATRKRIRRKLDKNFPDKKMK